MTTSLLLIVVGLATIAFGSSADKFYPAFLRRPGLDEKPTPRWLGRVVCFVVGAWFVYSGLLHLRQH